MVFPQSPRKCENGPVVGTGGFSGAEVTVSGTSTAGGTAMTAPAPEKTEVVEPVTAAEVPWVTIVWNDPVNLMSYVTLVFQKLLGHPRPKAEALMLDVHQKGRATVSI